MAHKEEYEGIFAMLRLIEVLLRRTHRDEFADSLQEFRKDLIEDRAAERKRGKLVRCAHEGCEERILPTKKNGLCNAHETYWCTGCKELIPAERLRGVRRNFMYYGKKKIEGTTYKLVNRCSKCHT